MRDGLRILFMVALSAALFLTYTAGAAAAEETSSLYVKKVENMEDMPELILGMDASCVPALERSGVVYRDFDGREQDVFQTLSEAGINHIRVRVWHDPYDSQGRGYGGGNCDIENAVEIGRRAAENGMKLIVDLHYSDFWADPAKQMAPKAWKTMDMDEKVRAVADHTREVLTRLTEAGAEVGMVQLGNETNSALCGETDWESIVRLMDAGSRAVREICPEALVAVHFANPENAGSYAAYARELDRYGLDYDVFASSYYPYWHGTLANLSKVLSGVAETYDKKVMVMETSYAWTTEDMDFSGNTVSADTPAAGYPFTVQGQANSVRDVIDTVVNKTVNGIGVVYWEGTWIGVGSSSWAENSLLWEKHGSGWASSFAAEYDPNDAGKYYGGCAVENQALFDGDGQPLESLKVFRLCRTGNEIDPVPDAAEDVTMTVAAGSPVVLPKTTDVILTDGTRKPCPVTWNIPDKELAAITEAGRYTADGSVEGLPVRCQITVEEANCLVNGGFETGDLTGWTLTELGHADELYVEDKKSDSLSGTKHMHFWSAKKDSVEFTLEQTLTDLPAGEYRYSCSIMGGDGGETEIYAYARINGADGLTKPMEITFYNSWDTAVLEGLRLADGDTLTVGIYVKAQGAGNGAWGKIDDLSVTRTGK